VVNRAALLWPESQIQHDPGVTANVDDLTVKIRSDDGSPNPRWLRDQRGLALEFATAGLSADTWNGYSEAHAIVPTVEDGTARLLWLRDIVPAFARRWRQNPM
jgi:hypothetical protein